MRKGQAVEKQDLCYLKKALEQWDEVRLPIKEYLEKNKISIRLTTKDMK